MRCKVTLKRITIYPENDYERKRLENIWLKTDFWGETHWYNRKLIELSGFLHKKKKRCLK